MTNAFDDNGSQYGLGRIPSTPDERNFPLSAFFETQPTALEVALAAVMASDTSKAQKALDELIVAALQGTPVPTPTPTPTPTPVAKTEKYWPDPDPVLDQGHTGHCVGFGSAQWCNTLGREALDPHFTNADGHDLYYECKIADGEPKQENGSSVHSAAKVLQARGLIKNYAWAASLDEVLAWIMTNGPVLVGTDWTNDMFTPDDNNVIHPTGPVKGGHCYALVGYSPTTKLIEGLNSWGPWGKNGNFYIPAAEFEMLAASNGECFAAVQVA